jgi:hypothetical protein
MVRTCYPSYAGGRNRKIAVQAALGVNIRHYLKNNTSKTGLGEWLKR